MTKQEALKVIQDNLDRLSPYDLKAILTYVCTKDLVCGDWVRDTIAVRAVGK